MNLRKVMVKVKNLQIGINGSLLVNLANYKNLLSEGIRKLLSILSKKKPSEKEYKKKKTAINETKGKRDNDHVEEITVD